ncbi:GNAT family N-acetyltransferase [Jiulongibacter sediminis]|uniref:Acetyltransferase n=1 Tax=Jiulongibacter sediminis TaxID=1605367 RepID=A0A0P7BPR4_9BACT|nr:GNAT family N-acetyltransferase [Jiulongibacter sediminis]KPM47229.1 acetyltransferase [Jiulongibacter sediminis]TBX22788.1 acetyltransferase [Jiulongibacter sediminis]
MLEIHKATEADLSLIGSLAHEIWPPTFGEILSKGQIEYMLNMMYSLPSLQNQMDEGIEFLLAVENQKTVGFSGIQTDYQKTGKTKIHKLYLLPETQGKGYGRLLIDHIAKIALQNGDSALVLNVNRFNKAYDFYLKTGFEKVGEENIDIGNGYLMEDFILEKPI